MAKAKAKALTTGDFWIGDAVQHVRGSPRGVVVSHNHSRGLLRVRWESRVEEWLPPKELELLVAR